MISVFGIISVAVAVVSVVSIMLHNRVMKMRAPVDAYLAALEDLLRERIDTLLRESFADSELRRLCGNAVDLELNEMIKALPDIDRAASLDMHTAEQENAIAIRETTEALNQAIEEYNRYITGSLPVVLMAQALGLETEDILRHYAPF